MKKKIFYLTTFWLMPLIIMFLLFVIMNDADHHKLLDYLRYYLWAYLVYLYVVLIIFIKKFGHHWTMPFLLSAVIYIIASSADYIEKQLSTPDWGWLVLLDWYLFLLILGGVNIVWALSFLVIKILRKIKQ